MRNSSSTKTGSLWDVIMEQSRKFDEQVRMFDEQSRQSEFQFKQAMERIDFKYDLWINERREMEARIAADRKETAERLAQDRRDSEARLERKFREFRSQKRWLVANFVAVLIGMGGIFAAIVILML